MKKFILGFLLGCSLFTAIPISAAIEDYLLSKANYKVMINGQIYSDSALPILNYKGYTYAPLRSMLSAAGLNINWDSEKGIATVTSTETSTTVLTGNIIDYGDYKIRINSLTYDVKFDEPNQKNIAAKGKKFVILDVDCYFAQLHDDDRDWFANFFIHKYVTDAGNSITSLLYLESSKYDNANIGEWQNLKVVSQVSSHINIAKIEIQNPNPSLPFGSEIHVIDVPQ